MSGSAAWLEIEQIIGHLAHAVDHVMGDGGLYDERTAARAFRQAEGDPVAAANLVRALRASLPHLGSAQPVERREALAEWPLGDVHHDRLPVVVTHPTTGEAVTVGDVRVVEAETPTGYLIRLGSNAEALNRSAGPQQEQDQDQLRRLGGCGVGATPGPGG